MPGNDLSVSLAATKGNHAERTATAIEPAGQGGIRPPSGATADHDPGPSEYVPAFGLFPSRLFELPRILRREKVAFEFADQPIRPCRLSRHCPRNRRSRIRK